MKRMIAGILLSLLAVPAFAQYRSIDEYQADLNEARTQEYQDMVEGRLYDNKNEVPSEQSTSQNLLDVHASLMGGGPGGGHGGGNPGGGGGHGGGNPGGGGHPGGGNPGGGHPGGGNPGDHGGGGHPGGNPGDHGGGGHPGDHGDHGGGHPSGNPGDHGGGGHPGDHGDHGGGGHPGDHGDHGGGWHPGDHGDHGGGHVEHNPHPFPSHGHWGNGSHWWRSYWGPAWYRHYSWWPGYAYYVGAYFAEDNGAYLFAGRTPQEALYNCEVNSPVGGCVYVGYDL
jgi:hypothetical protein